MKCTYIAHDALFDWRRVNLLPRRTKPGRVVQLKSRGENLGAAVMGPDGVYWPYPVEMHLWEAAELKVWCETLDDRVGMDLL